MTNIQEKGIHLVYKNLGETPKESIERYKLENPELKDVSLTYVGRLDPMAEGLLIFITTDILARREEFLSLPKTYIFEILWGLETDTGDILGLIENENNFVPKEENIKNFLDKSLGEFSQKYPIYSSEPVNGKPLFMWAREGKVSEIEIPEHKVSLYEAKFIERKEIKSSDLFEQIKEKIVKVKGDFRQEEIISKWQKVLKDGNKELFVDKIEASVSSGFYIRQFVPDLADSLRTCALVNHIIRTKVGDYQLL